MTVATTPKTNESGSTTITRYIEVKFRRVRRIVAEEIVEP